MALLNILKYPDERLHTVAKPVAQIDERIQTLVADMLETMYAAPGIGLAAPQVGQSIRLIVIDVRLRDDRGEVDESAMTELEKKIPMPLVLINPQITKKEGKTSFEEGCLSVPGFYETVQRANLIHVKAQTEKGEALDFSTDGLLAICIQHEIDHLNGILFVDYLSPLKRQRIKEKLVKYKKQIAKQ